MDQEETNKKWKRKGFKGHYVRHRYIPWHSTKPPDNYYCKRIQISHVERSCILRKQLLRNEQRRKKQIDSRDIIS